jgi:hypothetical protein
VLEDVVLTGMDFTRKVSVNMNGLNAAGAAERLSPMFSTLGRKRQNNVSIQLE